MMVRRTITQLTGIDPEYSKQFVDEEPKRQEAPQKAPEPVRSETPKPARKPRSAPKPPPAPKPPAPSRKPPEGEVGQRKMVNLTAVPLVRHLPELEKLSAYGITVTDAIKVAGRRTLARFEPVASFTERADEDRLPMSFAYKTNKAVDVLILEKLRAEVDPLNLRGEGALIRGQLEPLFWEDLDAVIIELKSRFSNNKE